MRVSVRVTAEDIERGTPANAKCCAVALAVKRKVSISKDVRVAIPVTVPSIEIFRHGASRNWQTPDWTASIHARDRARVLNFINRYDFSDTQRSLCKPFSFLLYIPKECLR